MDRFALSLPIEFRPTLNPGGSFAQAYAMFQKRSPLHTPWRKLTIPPPLLKSFANLRHSLDYSLPLLVDYESFLE